MAPFGTNNRDGSNPFKLIKSMSTNFFFNRHKEFSNALTERKLVVDDTLRDVKAGLEREEARNKVERERLLKTEFRDIRGDRPAHGNRLARLFSPPPQVSRLYCSDYSPRLPRADRGALMASSSAAQLTSSRSSRFTSPTKDCTSESGGLTASPQRSQRLASPTRDCVSESLPFTTHRSRRSDRYASPPPKDDCHSDYDDLDDNKKIVEMEKNQRPLLDHNRKLSERNRGLQQEMRKIEQKYAHAQDDFLTLRDAHERILKENTALKEKRVSPEKLEELDRYRNQVLEYSKCITALRSSGLEKDRRYEALVAKFKQLKKALKSGEDDKQSVVGSDYSGESSINLDTITEDFEESLNKDIEVINQQLYKENAELQKALNDLKSSNLPNESESLLRDQLNYAQSTIAQQQLLIETNQQMISQTAQLKATCVAQQSKIKALEQQIEELQAAISSQKEKSELLEFQVLEMEENRKSVEKEMPKEDKAIEAVEIYDENAPPIEVVKKTLNNDEVTSLKRDISNMRNATNLKLAQRQIIGRTEGYIGNLEDKVTENSQSEEIMKILKDKLNVEEKKANELEKKGKKSEEKLKELETKIVEKEKRIDEAEMIRKQSEERVIEMEKREKEQQKKLEEKEKRLAEFESVKQQLSQKNAELEKASKQFASKIADYEKKFKEQQAQIAESSSHAEQEKQLQEVVEGLKKKMNDMSSAKEKLDDEMRTMSKEMSKLKFNLQNKETELERERKTSEGLNSKLQEIVHSHQEESHKREQNLTSLKQEADAIRKQLTEAEARNTTMLTEYDSLKTEYEKFKDEQRPSIRTELERRFEETRYRLMCALEKIEKYEMLLETARKSEDGANLSQILEQEVVELKEFNAHLERQFNAQSEIIDALKMKIINQKKFNDLVFKLCSTDLGEVEDVLADYSKNKDNEGSKLAECIVYLMKNVRKNNNPLLSPLEISTSPQKIRPYNSIDSSGEWMSNSSEGMTSPDGSSRWDSRGALSNNHSYARGAASS